MPTSYSKLAIQNVTKLVPSKYMQRLNLELKRTFIIVVSLLKTHRRKAFLLSLGPATIIKIVTVLLPIMKLLPPTIKAIQSLSYFTQKNKNQSPAPPGNSLANNIPGSGTGAETGIGSMLSMDELFEIVWTPANDAYWERVHATVTRSGLCKTLGISLSTVHPGRVEILLHFGAQVSGGEGDSFHVSLLPTMIAMASQLTGMTLLPRHCHLQPIDFKCNILSDCDPSTSTLLARGAVVVRGEHSITTKVEVLKASSSSSGGRRRGGEGGGQEGLLLDASRSFPQQQSSTGWFSRSNSRSNSARIDHSDNDQDSRLVRSKEADEEEEERAGVVISETGLDLSQFVVCATGMQTSVVVRPGSSDPHDEEEAREMRRWREERRQQPLPRRTRTGSPGSHNSCSASSRSSRSSSVRSLSWTGGGGGGGVQVPAFVDAQDQSILLGDTLLSPVPSS